MTLPLRILFHSPRIPNNTGATMRLAAVTGAELHLARPLGFDIAYRPGDVLLFGPEPTGLDEQALTDPRVTARCRIPMRPGMRSLNLANAAAIAVYEAWRQLGHPGARG